MRNPCFTVAASAARCATQSVVRQRRRPFATARIAGGPAGLHSSRGLFSAAVRSLGPQAARRSVTSPDVSGRSVVTAELRWFSSIPGSRNGLKSTLAASTIRSLISPWTNVGWEIESDGLNPWAICPATTRTRRCRANHDLRFGSSVTPAARSPRCCSLPIRSSIRWKMRARAFASASFT